MFCTVFTPAYNRDYTLPRLYESLKKQTYKDFEWLIVDDGSTDATEVIVSKWLKEENAFKIRYYKKSNGGKHTAINFGIQKAKGKMFFIVDSDDYLTPNAIEDIYNCEQTISNLNEFAGISCCRYHENNDLVGDFPKVDYIDATNLERKKYNLNGDKAEAYYTNILKKYKFPEYEGEKFISECVVWNKIAYDGFKIRWFPNKIYICDYIEDGLTKNIDKIIANSPKGYLTLIHQEIKFKNVSIKEKYGYYAKYAKILKNKKDLKEISKDLEIGVLKLKMILLLESFYRKLK